MTRQTAKSMHCTTCESRDSNPDAVRRQILSLSSTAPSDTGHSSTPAHSRAEARPNRTADVTPRVTRRFRETRRCWGCPADFTATRRDVVFCSAVCGRRARGCDAFGRRRRAA